MKTLVVLPSYNERENILAIVEAILSLGPHIYVSVVDDSSPDKTADVLREAIQRNSEHFSRLDVVVRPGKGGRGGAVRQGFALGLKRSEKFDAFIEMDCDFSHDPKAIPEGLSLLGTDTPVVLGCRYPNGTIIGWPVNRRIFSFFANTLARSLIVWSVPDYTNGFRFYTREATKHLCSLPQKHTGYIYLSESLSYLLAAGFCVKTFPIIFRNRERGVSNTTLREIQNALFSLFQIAWSYRFRRA